MNFDRAAQLVCQPLPLALALALALGLAAICLHQGATGFAELDLAAPAAALLVPLGILEAHRETPIALVATALAHKNILMPLAYVVLGGSYALLLSLALALVA